PTSTLFPYTTLFRSCIPCVLRYYVVNGPAVLSYLAEEIGVDDNDRPEPSREDLFLSYPLQECGSVCLGDTDEADEDDRQIISPRSEEHTSELQSRFD